MTLGTVYGLGGSPGGAKVGPGPRGTRPAALQGHSGHWGGWTATGSTGAAIPGQISQARLYFWVFQARAKQEMDRDTWV